MEVVVGYCKQLLQTMLEDDGEINEKLQALGLRAEILTWDLPHTKLYINHVVRCLPASRWDTGAA